MKKVSKKLNKKVVDISKEYMEYLQTYNWPGNVRELENFIELVINTESIPINLEEKKKVKLVSSNKIEKDEDFSLEFIEKRHIKRVLEKYYGNIAISAKTLGIGRNTLYRKIEKYEINCSIMKQSSEMEQ